MSSLLSCISTTLGLRSRSLSRSGESFLRSDITLPNSSNCSTGDLLRLCVAELERLRLLRFLRTGDLFLIEGDRDLFLERDLGGERVRDLERDLDLLDLDVFFRAFLASSESLSESPPFRRSNFSIRSFLDFFGDLLLDLRLSFFFFFFGTRSTSGAGDGEPILWCICEKISLQINKLT